MLLPQLEAFKSHCYVLRGNEKLVGKWGSGGKPLSFDVEDKVSQASLINFYLEVILDFKGL